MRAKYETYDENNQVRRMLATSVDYGLLKNMTVRATLVISNHHADSLPEMVNHVHAGPNRGFQFKPAGMNFYAKYRLFSHDQDKKHLRVAVFSEFSTINQAHDEAEVDLLDDNKGFGYGFIVTKLQNRTAISLTLGMSHAKDYTEMSEGLGIEKRVRFGRSFNYALSFGKLISPREYTSYAKDNFNMYLEFMGRANRALRYFEDGSEIALMQPLHQASSYLEGRIGLQRVIRSQTRVELTFGTNIIGSPLAHLNPVLTASIAHLIF